MIFYTEEIKIDQAEKLLASCNLKCPEGVDYTVGVFLQENSVQETCNDKNRLVGCGSLKKDMIQGIAVDPAFQGEDLTAKILTHLIQKAAAQGITSLYLFTKPEKAMSFTGLGFHQIISARPYAALLEWGSGGIEEYLETIRKYRKSKTGADDKAGSDSVCGLIMNCNPFTKGHRYLVEKAAGACSQVYLLVVEEDKSLFSFQDRMNMVKDGVRDLKNVTVLPGGRYAVSELTFPSYFTKDENLAAAHAAVDAELFAQKIAPALGINRRFIGTEPLSAVTKIYNETLKQRLPKYGITVTEIPRLSCSMGFEISSCGGDFQEQSGGGGICDFAGDTSGKIFDIEYPPVSATRVRQLLAKLSGTHPVEGDFRQENGSLRLPLKIDSTPKNGRIKKELEQLIPASTLRYIFGTDEQDAPDPLQSPKMQSIEKLSEKNAANVPLGKKSAGQRYHRQVTLMELLDSREDRVKKQKELLQAYRSENGVLISITLNIPGPIKDSHTYRNAMHRAMNVLTECFAQNEILHQEIRELVTGPEGYLVVQGRSAEEVKKITCSIEDGSRLGRLFDMDVMTEKGSISRKDLGKPGRKCLICGEDAKLCARSQRHPMQELLAEVDRILEDAEISEEG